MTRRARGALTVLGDPVRRSTALTALTALALGGLVASTTPALAAHEDLVVTGLLQNGRLVTFPAGDPADASGSVKVTGIADGFRLASIDYRPATDELFGVAVDGDSYQLYVISDDAVATPVGTPQPLAGDVSIDFNPTVDRLRIVSTDDTNLRVNPNDGAVIVDGPLRYVDENAGTDPSVVGVAYTNSDRDPATGTMLFDLDAALGSLSQQVNANAGTLEERFGLAPRFGGKTGFDIYTEGATNVGIVSIFDKGRTTLYTLNVTNGTLTPAGRSTGNSSVVGTRPHVVDVAVPTDQ